MELLQQLSLGTGSIQDQRLLRIQVREILFDDAYLSKVIDDRNSWFMQMEVLDLIYHQFFLTANNLGRQLTTSPIFQPLSPQTLALVAAAIHCALSEYATGKKITVMSSQDEYRGKFCPSTVITLFYCRSRCITHQFHMAGCLIPPSPMVLLRWNSRSSIPIGTPQSALTPAHYIQRSSIPSLTSIRSAPISFQTLHLPPLSAMLSRDGRFAG